MDQVTPPTPLKTLQQINEAIDNFYTKHKVKHFHYDGIHTCPESQRTYDIVTSSQHEYSLEPKYSLHGWHLK